MVNRVVNGRTGATAEIEKALKGALIVRLFEKLADRLVGLELQILVDDRH